MRVGLFEREKTRKRACVYMGTNERACVGYNVFKTIWFGTDLGWLGPAGSTCDNLVLSWRHRPSRVSLTSQAACKQLWLRTNSYKRFSFTFFPPLTHGKSAFISFSFISAHRKHGYFPVLFRWGELQHISRDQRTNDHSWHTSQYGTIVIQNINDCLH